MNSIKYGVVYTPEGLADFTAELLTVEAEAAKIKVKNVLDPACGELSLLNSAKKFLPDKVNPLGIDIDKEAVEKNADELNIIWDDTILPFEKNIGDTALYWKKRLPPVSMIIANPPWSSEKIYDKSELKNAGFELVDGQYDSYVLFMELAYNLVKSGGVFGFIIPDSLFEAQNQKLREFLVKKTEIRVIARLGEKIFKEVNRATTVIICRKKIPDASAITHCFRLSTDDRKAFLQGDGNLIDYYNNGHHDVLQSRFVNNASYNFDIDTRSEEEELLSKLKTGIISFEETFNFGRGVEIYVLDAKYYRYGVTGYPNHLPNSSSINKQITYGEYVDNHMSGFDSDKIFNAFLMPFNSQKNLFGTQEIFENIGEATGKWRNGADIKNYDRVQGIVVDVRTLMHNRLGKSAPCIKQLADAIEKGIDS